jgi:pimeloyl-ACP methyl ester carboxylesterase
LVAEGRKKLLACPSEVVHGDFSACDAFDQMDRVDKARLPALIVCGEEDKLTPPKYSAYLADRIPGASLCLVPGAGHMVMLEKPREVGEAVWNFLRGL